MEIQEIANRLVELGRQGQWSQAQQELYAENIVSIEPDGVPGPTRVEGIAAISEKGKQFDEMVEEYHGGEVSEPIVADNYFTVRLMVENTLKGMGRQKMEEIAVYKVDDGKIVQEQFFYQPAPMPAQN